MLQLRQGGTGQTIMAVIVFAIIVVFILEFRQTSRMQTGSIKRECAAKIDGDCLTPKDYFAEYGLVVPRNVSLKQVKSLGLRKQVLDGLIERELLVGEAQRLGVAVDEEAAKQELRLGRAHASLPAASALRMGHMLDLVAGDEDGLTRDLVRELPILDAKTNEVDDDLYARVVRSMTNRSPKEFLKMQQRELLAARMRDIVRTRVRVSESEAWNAFDRLKSSAVIRFVKLDDSWFSKYVANVSDADVDKWVTDHKAELDERWKTESSKWKPDCLLASEIVQSFADDATEADKSLAKDKLDRARALLDKGKPFAEVARRYSDGPSALAGGGIGCLTAAGYGDGGDVLEKAVSALAPGAVSGIVETKKGYHLVRFERKLPANDVETEGRRALARPDAQRAAAEAKEREFAEKLIHAAQGGARLDDTLKKMVPEAVGLPAPAEGTDRAPSPGDASADTTAVDDPHAPKAEISSPFSVDGDPVPGAFGGPSIGKLAFELGKAEDVKPDPIQIFGGLVVIQLKEKTVATREEFEKEKGPIVRSLELEKRADALTRYMARIRKNHEAKIEVNERMLEEPKNADKD
ncbi:MAG TPA: peptidylprolyl isomerase [Polyangiaceae bacterium]|nr:peptidylprolyl isomerase [Polyangiaceae bacterium]